MKRLEEIVSRIEENKMDIDQIGESLKEARELIKFCKDKLYKTDEEIKKILWPLRDAKGFCSTRTVRSRHWPTSHTTSL